jgi:hypothetical protein
MMLKDTVMYAVAGSSCGAVCECPGVKVAGLFTVRPWVCVLVTSGCSL